MTLPIFVCVASLFLLLYLLRRDRLSLGLPLAYLGSLLIIHVPGAFAHLVTGDRLQGGEYVQTGITYTAIACVCFVVGVWVAHSTNHPPKQLVRANRRSFAFYCLIGGWIFVYALSPLNRIASVGAVIETGGAIWMLGTLLGLRAAVQTGRVTHALTWSAALAVYPTLMLVLGGFVSYGAAAVTIVLSSLTIYARTYARAALGILVVSLVGLTFFVNYFGHRDDIRTSVWGGASMENRLDTVAGMLTDFHLINLDNDDDLNAIDVRLNQNYFVGLAAYRLEQRQVDFLNGKSVTDGLIAVIPRALWPDKPTAAGSGQTVTQMTGIRLNEDTSWGVGNVMEFYINFGIPGLVIGFLGLGWLIGVLDLRAAAAERRGDFEAAILFFLPSVAIIDPQGSIVEITGGAAAALLAAYLWRWGWSAWQIREAAIAKSAVRIRRPGPGPAV